MVLNLKAQVKGYSIRFDDSPDNISWEMVDPLFEIDEDWSPVVRDASSGKIRQFSSLTDPAIANANFIGYVESAAWARGDGSIANGNSGKDFGQKVKVYRVGEVQVDLNAPSNVDPGELLVPFVVNGVVSNHVFTIGVGGKHRVERFNNYPSYVEDPCSVPDTPGSVSSTNTIGSADAAGNPRPGSAVSGLIRVFATWNTRYTTTM